MILSPTEAQHLLKTDELLIVPSIEGIIILPIDKTLSISQIETLQKLIMAMGLKPGMVQYIYTSQEKWEIELKEALERIEPKITLVFIPSNHSESTAEVEKSKSGICVFLPEIGKIDSELECKKAVWKVLKPFAHS